MISDSGSLLHIIVFCVRLSFLLVEDCNVICVDWAAGAVDPNYVRAAVNTRLVGKQVRSHLRRKLVDF